MSCASSFGRGAAVLLVELELGDQLGVIAEFEVLDEVETSTVTPGARELQAIGGGRYIPGRAGPATISIARTPIVRTAILTAQRHDHVVIITEDLAVEEETSSGAYVEPVGRYMGEDFSPTDSDAQLRACQRERIPSALGIVFRTCARVDASFSTRSRSWGATCSKTATIWSTASSGANGPSGIAKASSRSARVPVFPS